jgi:aspartate aminotransferase
MKIRPIKENITRIKPSATLLINERSKALIRQGKKVYKLGFGQSPFPVPSKVVQALRDNAHQKEYLPVKGLIELRRAVANYHHKKFGIHCSENDVLIGPGSKELLFLSQIVYKGEFLIPSPSWVSYEPQTHLANNQYSWIETKKENDYLLDALALDLHCSRNTVSPKVLFLNYPSNPTGDSFGFEQLKEIASIARKHSILIISDEIYGDIHHAGSHRSIATYYPEGTIVSSGLSKWCGAGGWRLGTFVFPKELHWLLENMAIVASETYTAASAPIQYAAIAAYEEDNAIEEYLKNSRLVLSKVATACSSILLEHKIHHPIPKGGFYLMPDFSFYKDRLLSKNIQTSFQLCEMLLAETGVALLPLSAFGMNESFLGARLSYVDFDGAHALDLIRKNRNTSAELLAPKVLEGIFQIIAWLQN